MGISSVGERLRAFRKRVGLNQVQMAGVLNIRQGFLSEVEAGKKMPGGEFFISLKRYSPQISIDWVLTGKGKMLLGRVTSAQQRGGEQSATGGKERKGRRVRVTRRVPPAAQGPLRETGTDPKDQGKAG